MLHGIRFSATRHRLRFPVTTPGRNRHERNHRVDHITLCVKNLAATKYLFTHILGFDVIWSAQDVGSEKSSMDTVVVQRGAAKIALMQGRNKGRKSQICEFVETYGEGVQHIALGSTISKRSAANGNIMASGSAETSGWTRRVRPSPATLHLPVIPRLRIVSRTDTAAWHRRIKTFVRATVESLYRDIERDQIKGVARTIIDYETLPLPFEEDVEAASLRHAS